MSKNDQLEVELKKKLHVHPDRNFDQRFWANFDLEFGVPQTSRQRPWVKWATAFAALLVIAGGSYELTRQKSPSSALPEASVFAEILENEEILDNVELLAELELTPTSEEEWAILEEDV
jgi:hypothetical protein